MPAGGSNQPFGALPLPDEPEEDGDGVEAGAAEPAVLTVSGTSR